MCSRPAPIAIIAGQEQGEEPETGDGVCVGARVARLRAGAAHASQIYEEATLTWKAVTSKLTTAEADISEITAPGKPTALFLNSPSTSCTNQ
jgi:hypothetical protein